jgi:hypothetical protein
VTGQQPDDRPGLNVSYKYRSDCSDKIYIVAGFSGSQVGKCTGLSKQDVKLPLKRMRSHTTRNSQDAVTDHSRLKT